MLKSKDVHLNGLASTLNTEQLTKLLTFVLESFTTQELRRCWSRDQQRRRGVPLDILYEVTIDLYREDMIKDILI
mgnify:CR=1